MSHMRAISRQAHPEAWAKRAQRKRQRAQPKAAPISYASPAAPKPLGLFARIWAFLGRLFG